MTSPSDLPVCHYCGAVWDAGVKKFAHSEVCPITTGQWNLAAGRKKPKPQAPTCESWLDDGPEAA